MGKTPNNSRILPTGIKQKMESSLYKGYVLVLGVVFQVHNGQL
jgi:hypothetical protein